MDEDDDIYDPSDILPSEQSAPNGHPPNGEVKMADAEEGEEEGEEGEDGSDDVRKYRMR